MTGIVLPDPPIGTVSVPVKMSPFWPIRSLWSTVDARSCRLPVRTFGQRADHGDRTPEQVREPAPFLYRCWAGSSVKRVSSWNSEAGR